MPGPRLSWTRHCAIPTPMTHVDAHRPRMPDRPIYPEAAHRVPRAVLDVPARAHSYPTIGRTTQIALHLNPDASASIPRITRTSRHTIVTHGTRIRLQEIFTTTCTNFRHTVYRIERSRSGSHVRHRSPVLTESREGERCDLLPYRESCRTSQTSW